MTPRALAPFVLLALAACGAPSEPSAEAAALSAQLESRGLGADGTQAGSDEPEGSLATGEMALGREDAPLTVIEYASVTCPHCARFHERYFGAIESELIDTGLVRFVYREFPTSPVPLSYAGSMLARCAATEGGAPAYFAVNAALFEQQRAWVYGEDPRAALEDVMAEAGLEAASMDGCLRRGAIKAAIDDNLQKGRADGVRGTPSLVVDGELFDIGRPVDELVAALRERARSAR